MNKTCMAILVSVLVGCAWAGEMWWRGWEGLHWIGRFHLSILLASVVVVSLLGAWSPRFVQKRRLAKLAVGVALSLPVHAYFGMAGYFSFVVGPSALPLFFLGGGSFFLGRCMGLILFFSLPISGYVLGRWLNIEVHLSGLYLGLGTLAIAAILLPLLLQITHLPGSPDLIHTIKSGLAIPVLLFSFLFPMLPPCWGR